MRQRILRTMIAVLVAMAILLGLPLTVITWRWIDRSAHEDLAGRLKTMSEYVLAEEAAGRLPGPQALELDQLRLLLPSGGTLILQKPDGVQQLGPPVADDLLAESVTLGPGYTLTLSVPSREMRTSQWVAVGVLGVVIGASVAAGALVALLTARRLTEPLIRVAHRAAAMARGDLRSPWPYQDIDELDRVTAALSEANAEIARRLEREGQIIGDVSHQLRSRLTAIGLRLDELTLHPDPAVVTEAQAGVAQVERLATELDELVSASRAEGGELTAIAVAELIDSLTDDFAVAFAAHGRTLRVHSPPQIRAVHGRPGRLRETLSALLDNALHHGAGETTVGVEDLGSADVLRFTVADRGRGVPDRLADQIFRRGFSAGHSSGIGLSMARALIESDGGRLDLVSRRPAVFAVVVPVARDDGSAGPQLRRDRVPHR
ncbi:putative two-component histidine kinase [Gordonia hirsuta DSM 44140 = NBRC 16056]|uniref:Signal transduction histidine-protein kinase/phosphatase MprB n=1 Tax=Gordonia hirsuta DSM 44140 = NBRC 16056 TaxID=1121927 RepID=L7L9L6_9ACTN|nr:HAMP domain-containing sensor histidine kinase [Gordonia hirsuta]GAC56742.1 putative two-component histidine kinase [Gordonia hirsuta DSM 44140 = NBRC 16056]